MGEGPPLAAGLKRSVIDFYSYQDKLLEIPYVRLK